MKKIKSILLTIFAFVLFLPVVANASDDLVKVYIFEAGGCPYCEAEIEYLEGLDSYKKKFTIVKKELYVDHVDWKEGKDYEVGVKVANAFLEAGFENASYQGTPFVVISDLYAAATYSTELEDVINEAYEAGDKDVVGCFEDGGTNCLNIQSKTESNTGTSSTGSIVTTIICTLIILITYLIKSSIDQKRLYEALGIKKPEFNYDTTEESDYESSYEEDEEVEIEEEKEEEKPVKENKHKKNKNK